MTVGPNGLGSIGQVERPRIGRVASIAPRGLYGSDPEACSAPRAGKPWATLTGRDRQPGITTAGGRGLRPAVCDRRRWFPALPLDGRSAPLNGSQPRQIELGPAVEAEDAVLLLEDVGEQGVTIAEHQRVVEQRAAQRNEPMMTIASRPLTTSHNLGRTSYHKPGSRR